MPSVYMRLQKIASHSTERSRTKSLREFMKDAGLGKVMLGGAAVTGGAAYLGTKGAKKSINQFDKNYGPDGVRIGPRASYVGTR